jgi:hypothetical protein
MERVTDFIRSVIGDVISYALRLGPQEWLLVLFGVLVAGALCLRGFGSRNSY